MKTTACILLLAAAAWGQQVAVPQGGNLGPSSKLSDAATLSADKVDGRHSSSTPGANTVPAADSEGKLAPGWLPLPTPSSLGGVFMDAGCLAGNHVSGIDAASGRLECSADAGDWSNIGNKPLAFPPDTGSAAWQDLLATLALKAPLADAALTGATTAEEITVSGFLQVGGGTPAVSLSYLAAADPNPAGACAGGSEMLKATSDGSTKRFYCNAGSWAEDVPASSALGDPGSDGVLKRTALNTTGVAGYADIVAMWTSCTAGYLKYDGSCSTIAGGPASKAASPNQFLNSYDSGTGLFGSARPTWADVDKAGSSLADLSTRGFAQLTGTVAANQLPKPTTSAIGAVYSDADCGAGQHFNGIDTSTGRLKCSADAGGLGDPGANGIIKRTALNTTGPAARADVVALWISCTSGYLKQDGSCDTPSGTESTPAMSEDATTVTSTKPLVAPEQRSNATTDQSMDLPTAVSPQVSAAGHGKFSFQGNKMRVSENGGAYQDVLNVGSGFSAIVSLWTTCTAGYLKYDGTCSTITAGLQDPGTNGIVKRTALNTTTAAARADVLALWTTCTSGYLKQDGTCDIPTGSESTPSLTEDATTVYSSKPVSVQAGSQSKFTGITEGTPVVQASKNSFSFNSTSHHPAYSYNGGAAKDVLLAGDAAAVFDVTAYGATGNGTTDDFTAIQAAITAAMGSAGEKAGGVVYFPAGTYLANSCFTLPNDGGTAPAKQPPLTLRGAGAPMIWLQAPQGGSVLDLRCNPANGGKISSFGGGVLTIQNLVLEDKGSDSAPFVYVTNTILQVYASRFIGTASGASAVNDAIILGGTTNSITNDYTGAFQGYGTVIRDNMFDKVKRAVLGQAYSNAIRIVDNNVGSDSGYTTGAPFEFAPSPSTITGLYVAGNLVETLNYKYGVSCPQFCQNNYFANSFFDSGGSFTSAYNIGGTGNFIVDYLSSGDYPCGALAAGNICFSPLATVASKPVATGMLGLRTGAYSWSLDTSANGGGPAIFNITSGLSLARFLAGGSLNGSGHISFYGHLVPFTATGAINNGQVVKVDSGHSNQVMVTTTTDTGPGIPVGIAYGTVASGATTNIQVSGVTAGNNPVLGTGTCTRGQFVIVDTTTNGAIQCTATFTAGAVIGTALTSQSTVGGAVQVLVQPR